MKRSGFRLVARRLVDWAENACAAASAGIVGAGMIGLLAIPALRSAACISVIAIPADWLAIIVGLQALLFLAARETFLRLCSCALRWPKEANWPAIWRPAAPALCAVAKNPAAGTDPKPQSPPFPWAGTRKFPAPTPTLGPPKDRSPQALCYNAWASSSTASRRSS